MNITDEILLTCRLKELEYDNAVVTHALLRIITAITLLTDAVYKLDQKVNRNENTTHN